MSVLSTKILPYKQLEGMDLILHPQSCPTCRTCRKHNSVNTGMTVMPRVKVGTTGRLPVIPVITPSQREASCQQLRQTFERVRPQMTLGPRWVLDIRLLRLLWSL